MKTPNLVAGIYSRREDGSPGNLIKEGDWASVRVHENTITMSDGIRYSLDKFCLIS